MKKIILFLAAIMPLAVMAEDLKFGYINTQEVMMLMPEISTIEKQMAEFNAQNTKYMQDMQKELEDKMAKYDQEKATLSEAVRKVKEEDLQELYRRFQTAQQTLYTETKQQSLLQPVQEKLKLAIQTVGQKNNFFMVFESEAGILYKSPKAVDIAPLVKKELGIL